MSENVSPEDQPEGPHKDKNGDLVFKLSKDDSALIVHADGGIELISTELNPDNENDYIGDIEDLNKTFSLVLALAASLENEDLYNRIFHNLNLILMRKWENLDPKTKQSIQAIRDQKNKGKRNHPFYEHTGEEDFIRMHRSQFGDRPPRRPKRHSLDYLLQKGRKWSPYDKTLKAHFKDYRADAPPEEDE